ncbi:MAG TPA: hypothetical protein DCL61_31885 [Cyanobacteria bacterium UBA12227]|nr:hypothetical protein [Cyanobacteria bacterium UBA12227]HAX89884.1 hypothetical protein [Cyanobacteria bacterium UBA11370]HBY76040.1 hypothetical protein [Cyanobacteria bacterium UBA11148]
MLGLSNYRTLIGLVAVLSATPVVAQTNFANLTIALGFPPESGMVAGNTGGSYSLPSLVNRDRNNTPCLGYGDETPDHKLVLEQDFPKLSIKVNSGGNDTTLVIKGPNGVALCGDDTGSKKDASVEASNLEAGEYSVWVGSINPGQNWNYTLSVRE